MEEPTHSELVKKLLEEIARLRRENDELRRRLVNVWGD